MSTSKQLSKVELIALGVHPLTANRLLHMRRAKETATVKYPLGFALARNGKNNLGYSKGGYPLNKNGIPLNENNTNALKR